MNDEVRAMSAEIDALERKAAREDREMEQAERDEAKTGPGGAHYGAAVQPIDLIEAMDLGFHDGNALKYVARWRAKGGVLDLEKAVWYLQRLIELEKGKTCD